ncbi:MAG TPA: glycoside hydrolase family 99-like domain-containing protein, partial [Terriglobia bacterium]|nr:glycoside hydrolase family 99-like domain-containing protein [Terriglobia bacterium]
MGSNPDPEARNANLQELKQDLIECERAVADSRKHVQNLNHLLTQREANLEACHREIARLNSWIGFLKARKSAYEAILESNSWKVMAPARLALRAWRSLREKRRRKLRSQPGETQSSDLQKANPADTPHSRDIETAVLPRPDSEMGWTPSTIEALRDRKENLEQAFTDLLYTAGDNRGDGRYIHPVEDALDANSLDVKAIAFYDTRVGSPENSNSNAWIDVSKAKPRYLGHYQPHIPEKLGYYDLRVPDVFANQVELAKQYGLYGFCFQVRTLPASGTLGPPLEQLLSDPSLKISFCVSCNSDAIMDASDTLNRGAHAGHDSSSDFLRSLARALADDRYVRIDAKPLLLLYGIRDGTDHVRQWHRWATAVGLPGLYVVACVRDELKDTSTASVDATLRDPTFRVTAELTSETPRIDRQFRGRIHSYSSMIESDSALSDSLTIQNVVTGWDNEPGHAGEGRSFAGTNPGLYARWLERSCRRTMQRPANQRFIFITAWNNWPDGAHLEPDQRFGYGYLHATANVLRYYYRDPSTEALIRDINSRFTRTSEVAVVFHCFYEDLIDPIFKRYLTPGKGFDLIVTVRSDVSPQAIDRMRHGFPNIFFLRHENRGRDIRPFLFALDCIQSLGYRFACKIHTKKTPQAEGGMGDVWRQSLMDQLLGATDSVTQALRKFQADPRLGVLIPRASLEDLRETRHYIDNTFWLDRLLARMNRTDLVGNYAFSFPAGSMYWFRVDA